MSRAAWSPGADLADPLSNQEPTEYDVVELVGGTDAEMAARFAVMAACPRHRFRALTDQLDRAGAWLAWARTQAGKYHQWQVLWYHYLSKAVEPAVSALAEPGLYTTHGSTFPVQNLMIGTTVRTQAEAAERLPVLAEIPARRRFVRLEPSEAIDFTLHGSRVAGWDEDVVANMLTGEWRTSPRQEEPSEGVGLDLVEIAAGAGPEQLGYIQDIGRKVLDAQRWAPCADEECAAGALVDCHRCGNTAEQLVSGPALAIVVESTDPAKVSPVVDIPGHGMRSWNQQPA